MFKSLAIKVLSTYKKMIIKDLNTAILEDDFILLTDAQRVSMLKIKNEYPDKIQNVDRLIAEIRSYTKYA